MATFPTWLRIAGKHAPATAVLRKAAPWLEARGIAVQLPEVDPAYDYTQVDPALERAVGMATVPSDTLGYAGFTPEQRETFVQWTAKPAEPVTLSGLESIPAAFEQLFCAGLEVMLIESLAAEDGTATGKVLAFLETLADAPLWRMGPAFTRGVSPLSRLLMLAARLTGDPLLADLSAIAPPLAGTALGILAQQTTARLSATDALHLAFVWQLTHSPPSPALTALRLDDLAAQPQGEILQRALHSLPEAAFASRPFRTAHRDLRLSFPQPDLRPALEPLLADLLSPVALVTAESEGVAPEVIEASEPVSVPEPASPPRKAETPKAGEKGRAPAKEWSLVLEFSESRSQYAPYALDLARKQGGYTTLLDEDRTIVHRITFRKSEIRRFWRLWEYVQGWNSARVYLNGEELQKWQVWPWSQLFR